MRRNLCTLTFWLPLPKSFLNTVCDTNAYGIALKPTDAYPHFPIHQNPRKDLTQSLGWIINQEKFKLKPTQVFSFLVYEYHLDSALVKPTQEICLNLLDLILRLKSKHILTATGKDGPGGTPSNEALSVSPQIALEISSVIGQPPSLVRDYFSSPRVVAKSRKRDEGRRCLK